MSTLGDPTSGAPVRSNLGGVSASAGDPVRLFLLDELQRHPDSGVRILDTLLRELQTRGTIPDPSALRNEARLTLGLAELPSDGDQDRPITAPGDSVELQELFRITVNYAASVLSLAEATALLGSVNAAESKGMPPLTEVVFQKELTFGKLCTALESFCKDPTNDARLREDDATYKATITTILRHLVSSDRDLLDIASQYITIQDLYDLSKRIIGDPNRIGQIGGKAASMLLAFCILREELKKLKHVSIGMPLRMADSWYIRTDVQEEFLRKNGLLADYEAQKYRTGDELEEGAKRALEIFQLASFPEYEQQQIQDLISACPDPMVDRSSSLLEDRAKTPFYGKYRSVFVGMLGPLAKRLGAALGAIKEVFASTLASDPINYRRQHKEHGLIDENELMAVLVQRVVGKWYGPYFFPIASGVAFSRNERPMEKSVKPEHGSARTVMGLGTHAVDRSAKDHVRIFAPGKPVSSFGSDEEAKPYCQTSLDVIDGRDGQKKTITFEELCRECPNLRPFADAVSFYRDRMFNDVRFVGSNGENVPCITFENLIKRSSFPKILHFVLDTLEKAYGYPVDVEFAFDGEALYILQCRRQALLRDTVRESIPTDLQPDDLFFRASGDPTLNFPVRVDKIRYLLYVDPDAYAKLKTSYERASVAHTIGRLNRTILGTSHDYTELPKQDRIMLMVPGRFGNNDGQQGVPLNYSEISDAAVIVEQSFTVKGTPVDFSYGTHCGQDLIERGIACFPLDLEGQTTTFSQDLLTKAPNLLASLVPDDSELEGVIRVVDLEQVVPGRRLKVIVDGDKHESAAFLVNA